jgi:hypothetical protein
MTQYFETMNDKTNQIQPGFSTGQATGQKREGTSKTFHHGKYKIISVRIDGKLILLDQHNCIFALLDPYASGKYRSSHLMLLQ